MLSFQNVSVNQKNGSKIIDQFNLWVGDGSIVGLIGPDQEGKSAILQAASGGRKPDRGEIMLDGQSIYQPSDSHMKLGYLPRDCGFYEQLTVEEYFELFLALYKVNGRYRHRRIEEVLQVIEAEEYRRCFLSDVPAQVKPFLALGKTILHKPSWLLLDEPFGNLDMIHRQKMLDCLSMLWEDGCSLIINSQVFPEVTPFFTDLVFIEGGELISKGSVEDVFVQALRASQIRIHVMEGVDEALAVLRENDLVERVIVDKNEISLLFSGGAQEEAALLTRLVQAGVSVQSFIRDPMNLSKFIWR